MTTERGVGRVLPHGRPRGAFASRGQRSQRAEGTDRGHRSHRADREPIASTEITDSRFVKTKSAWTMEHER